MKEITYIVENETALTEAFQHFCKEPEMEGVEPFIVYPHAPIDYPSKVTIGITGTTIGTKNNIATIKVKQVGFLDTNDSPFKIYRMGGRLITFQTVMDGSLATLKKTIKREDELVVESLNSFEAETILFNSVPTKEKIFQISVAYSQPSEVICYTNYLPETLTLEKKPHFGYPHDPLEIKTSKFTPDTILFNDGEFVVARGQWCTVAEPALACRWHTPGEIGYPNGYGKPQWMLLPAHTVGVKNTGGGKFTSAKLELLFNHVPESVKPGSWLSTNIGTCLVVNKVVADSNEFYVIYPNNTKEIVGGAEIRDVLDPADSALHHFHKGKIMVWLSITNQVWLTTPTEANNIFNMRSLEITFTSLNGSSAISTPQWELGRASKNLGYLHQLNYLTCVAILDAQGNKELLGSRVTSDHLAFLSGINFNCLKDTWDTKTIPDYQVFLSNYLSGRGVKTPPYDFLPANQFVLDPLKLLE